VTLRTSAAILLSLSVAACGPAPGDTATSQSEPKPNILFIMLDDMGKEWVSAYGADAVSTPSIDALAADGMRFDNAWATPQCTPTRMALLTGQYPFRNGWVNHWDVPRWGHGYFDWQQYPSLAGTMRAAGYATVAAGKWQVNDFRIEPEAMRHHGFDSYAMWTGFETGVEPSAERYWDPYIHTLNGSRTYEGRFGTDVFVEHLGAFIEQHQDQPWFAYFPLALPHGPFVTTPDAPDLEGDNQARYTAMVEYGDAAIGALVQRIDALGLRDDTVIVVTADNGSPRGMTGSIAGRAIRGGKSLTTENGSNGPFIGRWPARIQSGGHTDVLVDFTDMLPTFAELAGAELPGGFVIDGRSFAGLLRGEANDGPRSWVMAMGGRNEAAASDVGVENRYVFRDRVIRDARYKLYVAATPDRTAEKLVDLETDPGEEHNLLGSDDPAVRAAYERLMAVARSFPDRDNDPRYTPRGPNAWDVDVTVESQIWKQVSSPPGGSAPAVR
jgi:arylsulfatase A-like enzyme